MAAVSRQKLRRDIQRVLKGADLSQLSAKKVRRQLEEEYDCDLTTRKQEIDSLLMELMSEHEKEAQENSKEKTARSGASSSNGHGDEEDEEAEDEEEEASDESDFEPPEDVSGKLAKTNRSSKHKGDEELARELQQEEMKRTRNTRSGNSPRTKPVQTKQKRKAKSEGDAHGSPSKKRRTGYMSECYLSPPLAEVIGKDSMARSEVVKKMWEIIRERNLMDPKNKQFMLCDDQLLKVFGRKRVRTFGMMKYLSKHIHTNPDEV